MIHLCDLPTVVTEACKDVRGMDPEQRIFMETGGTSGKGTCSVEKKHDSFGETLGMGHCAL